MDGKNGVVSVRWNNGNYGYYRMGAGGKFELKMAPKPVVTYMKREIKVEEEEEEESEYEDDVEEAPVIVEEKLKPKPVQLPVVKPDAKTCEYCGGTWTENNLSTSICVQCTAKLWKGEIVNRNNEFERYDKLAFINL